MAPSWCSAATCSICRSNCRGSRTTNASACAASSRWMTRWKASSATWWSGSGMGSVYVLTLRQLTGRWRVLIMTVLAAMPVFVAALALRSRSAPSVAEFETIVFSTMLAGSIGPLIVLAIAAAAFANEIEDRTLANLVLAPIPRWQIVVPKLLAAITIAGPFIAVSAFVTSYIAFLGDVTAMVAVTT